MSGQAFGILTMAAQLGLEAILVKPKRSIGPIVAQVTLREVHTDELEITDHPVEMGAAITDHAFKRPAEVVIEFLSSNSPQQVGVINGLIGAVSGTLAGIGSILSGSAPDQNRDLYEQLLALQESRDRFDVFTGKRAYTDMLLKSLVVTTDKQSENTLAVTATLRQIIIVQTQVVQLTATPLGEQQLPQSTAPVVDKGFKQLSSGLGSVNPMAAAKSLVSSSINGIADQARVAIASSPAGGITNLFF